MRALLRMVAAVSPLLAVLACGGRFDSLGPGPVGDGGGGGQCPATVIAGGSCGTAGLSCSIPTHCGGSIACSCEGGVWSCPQEHGPSCSQACPTSVVPGSSCDPSTQGTCEVNASIIGCDGNTYGSTCTCQVEGMGGGGAEWSCSAVVPECFDAGPQCPPSYEVTAGAACSTPADLQCSSDIAQYDCNGNFIGDATCQCYAGGWACVTATPVCDAGPPPCPDPGSVEQGVSCFSESQQCPGNPQVCGGQTLYDAFQCTGGQWDDIASTVCDLDAGAGGP